MEQHMWCVRWNARKGHYSDEYEPTVKVFTTKQESLSFKRQLTIAQKTLEYAEDLSIKIERIK